MGVQLRGRGEVTPLDVGDVSWLCHRAGGFWVGPASAPAASGEFCRKRGGWEAYLA